jgi:hypothetical protein
LGQYATLDAMRTRRILRNSLWKKNIRITQFIIPLIGIPIWIDSI